MSAPLLAVLLLAGLGSTDPSPDPSPALRDTEPEVADEVADEAAEIGHALGAGLRAGNAGYGAQLGWRMQTRRAFAWGLDLEGVYLPQAYIAGLAVDDDLSLGVRAPLIVQAHRSRSLTIALHLAPGLRYLRSFEPDIPADASLSVTVDLGVAAYVHRDRFSWLLGVDNPFSVQVSPITDLNVLGTLLTTGPVVPLNDRLQWFATVEAGGLFGSDGDAGKFLIRATTGLRGVFGPSARDWRVFY